MIQSRSALLGPRWLSVPMLALTALIGCSSDGTTARETPAAEGATRVEITAGSLRFEPDAIDIRPRQEVAIVLRSADIEHDLVIDAVDFHLQVGAGQRREGGLRIDTAGTYSAYCSVPGHRAAGMEMNFTVDA